MYKSGLNFNKLIIMIFIILMILFVYQIGFSQSIESVKEEIKSNNLDAAEKDVTQILQKDKNNVEALELLNQIKKLKKKKESEILTKKALIAIDNEDFEVAYNLLEKALVLDPDNEKARELFLSLNEVVNIEKKSEEQIAKKKEKESVQIAQANQGEGKKEKENGEGVTEQKGKVIEKPGIDVENKKLKQEEFHNLLEAEISPLFAFTNSNRLDYINSSQSLIGSRVGVVYYPNLINRKVGVSLDYISFFIKTSGNEYIKFNIHRFNFSLRYRKFVLNDKKGNKLLIEPKVGYSYFYLKNLMNFGAYDFKKLYGPVIGINLLDPVFYRFIDKDLFKKLGMKIGFNLLYIPQKEAPVSPEFYIGTFYSLKSFNINLGFRSYMIFKGDIRETYNDIELGVSYFM